jgi:hypothetical protein
VGPPQLPAQVSRPSLALEHAKARGCATAAVGSLRPLIARGWILPGEGC